MTQIHPIFACGLIGTIQYICTSAGWSVDFWGVILPRGNRRGRLDNEADHVGSEEIAISITDWQWLKWSVIHFAVPAENLI